MFRKKKPRPVVQEMAVQRAPHNERYQLIPAGQPLAPPSASDLVDAAAMQESLPALSHAVATIAQRFDQFVSNIHELNKTVGQFKNEVIGPFKEELRYLRHTTGDRLNHVSTDLEKYVAKLDQVLWGALRAQGMSDAQIREFRTETGMEPEAPRGFEIETHMAQVAEMEATIERLACQNRRLIAAMSGHVFGHNVKEWVFHPNCICEVCSDRRKVLEQATQEAAQ